MHYISLVANQKCCLLPVIRQTFPKWQITQENVIIRQLLQFKRLQRNAITASGYDHEKIVDPNLEWIQIKLR